LLVLAKKGHDRAIIIKIKLKEQKIDGLFSKLFRIKTR